MQADAAGEGSADLPDRGGLDVRKPCRAPERERMASRGRLAAREGPVAGMGIVARAHASSGLVTGKTDPLPRAEARGRGSFGRDGGG
ncbi:hypothetical protein MBRA_05329 [Methylobacterium brachiatum]|nr:hypothetical protein MBRA_05329 [Methylobacterium brachiatum]